MKKVKRTAAALLAASMLLTTPAWAVGQELSVVQERSGDAVQLFSKTELTESQQQALEKMYQIIPELKGLTLQNVEYNEDKTAWGGFLTDGSLDVTPDKRRIQASIAFDTQTGELSNFYNPQWAAENLPSPALVKGKAAEFARRLLGDRLKDYEMGEIIGYISGSTLDDKGNKITMTSAQVYFNQLINGVPFLNSGFQVSVDSAGHITEFRKEKDNNQDSAKFPDPSRAMTKEAAEKAFAGLVEMKLSYNSSQPLRRSWLGKGGGETIPVLMYYPSFSGFIVAETGKPLDDGDYLQQSQRIILSGEGKKFYAATPEEGARLLAEEFGVDMAGMKFSRVMVHDLPVTSGYQFKGYSWHSEPQQGTDSEPDWNEVRSVYLNTLADTGEIVGFSIQDDSGRGKQGTVSREDAQKTAVQFLQRYLKPGAAELEIKVISSEENFPDWVDKSKLTDQLQQRPQFFVQFTETYQGIPVMDRSYPVRVDALTGKVIEFGIGCRNSSVTLPDSNGAVTADVAKAEYFKHHPLRLVYFWPEYYEQKAPSPRLVYLPVSRDWSYIDALTGKTVVVERN